MPRRNVAVKVMPSDVRDPELRRMFNAEADVLAHLSAHPVDRDRLPGGHLGRRAVPTSSWSTARGRSRSATASSGSPSTEVLAIGVRMASALESAHRAGLVHRDVKPSNILITTFGAPVLADFGISSSLAARDRRRGARDVDPVERPGGRRRADRRDRSPARCGASGRPCTRSWPATARSSGASAGRTPRSSCAGASRGRATPRSRAPTSRHRCRPCSPRAMTPRSRPSPVRSAREFAEALREVQAELGISPTPLEVPDDEWSAASGPVDFGDTTMRGPARRASSATSAARAPDGGVAALARDEDTDFSTPAPRRRAGAARGSSAGGRPSVVAVAAVVIDARR